MKLENLTVIVTGATSGIGLALTERLLRLNNQVVAVGRNEAVLAALKAQYGEQVHPVCADLSTSAGVDTLVLKVEQQHPHFDVLINNAAIQMNYSFINAEHIHARIQREVYTNLTAPITLVGLLLPHLLYRSTPTAVVNITSGLALQPKQSAPVYCATKAGLHIFTRALRYQLAQTPVKVFDVMLPLVATPMTEGRGRNNMTMETVVSQILSGLQKERCQMYVGKVKLLRMMVRWMPGFAERILKNS